MKLLLATVGSECVHTDLEMKYLYSVVADSPMDVNLRCFGADERYMDIFEEIASAQYNIVYLHADEYNLSRLMHIAELVKKAVPSIAIVFGGMEVSFETKSFMQGFPYVDYVIRGEGESVLFSFVKTLLSYEFDFEAIAGLAYREGDQVIVNPLDAPLEPDDLPFPYERFEAGCGTVYYETIRGTSDRTVYSRHLPDARVRALSLGRVCTELRYFLAKEVERVVFLDRFFNFNSERAYRILEYIINNDNGVTSFEFNLNADELDEETLRLLSEAREGLIMLNIDVASTNPDVLMSIGRSENIYRLMYNTTRLLKNGNVKTVIHVRAGLPMETETMFARSFNKTYSLAEGMPVRIDSLKACKGSVLREEASRLGYLYSSEAPYEVISTGHMRADELLKIRRIARVVECYAGDSSFNASITKMMNDTGLKPYDLFSGLSSYIKRNSLTKKLRKKENFARILYAYAGGLYEEFGVIERLTALKEVILSELSGMVSEDALRKFIKKGWIIDNGKAYYETSEEVLGSQEGAEPAAEEGEADSQDAEGSEN